MLYMGCIIYGLFLRAARRCFRLGWEIGISRVVRANFWFNASIVLDFGKDPYFMISLFKLLRDKNDIAKCKRQLKYAYATTLVIRKPR